MGALEIKANRLQYLKMSPGLHRAVLPSASTTAWDIYRAYLTMKAFSLEHLLYLILPRTHYRKIYLEDVNTTVEKVLKKKTHDLGILHKIKLFI